MATQTIIISAENPDGLTVDELADFCLRVAAAGATGTERPKVTQRGFKGVFVKIEAQVATKLDYPAGSYAQAGEQVADEAAAHLRALAASQRPPDGERNA